MKSNLETIKKALQNHEQNQHAVSFSKLKGEIKAFEKELRGMCTLLGADSSCYVKRKEILGEEEIRK